MNTELLEQPPLYREWMAEATSKGLQQGREDGAREAVLAVWRARFGEPDASVVANLAQRHDPAERDKLVGALADAASIEAARALLGLGAADQP